MGDILKDRVISEKDAVMFDIDDTLIFINGQANLPIINLLKYAMNLGYKIIIITARPANAITMTFTKWQLRKYGIPYHSLIITPAQNKGNIKVKTGLNYILSVGDQPTDLTHTKYSIKISI
jgi:hydroxymethylpyrimidine pyrophosphatase-like HAD family hydrolase|tara:strand:+ start:2274 stop:2636 length:363 start_codon:yes stop_codon:yes gene_type:complete